MINIPGHFYEVYRQAINDYHIFDDINRQAENPYEGGSIEHIAYQKSWIDTVQWHLEDLIRDPIIESAYALFIKKRIDALNQKRTDIVERIDDYFHSLFSTIVSDVNAKYNTESLGWALDRLSILALKEYHTLEELNRVDAAPGHLSNCMQRKNIITVQRNDLLQSINWLIEEIQQGKKVNKVYRQLKMYNDPAFNPVLYNKRTS